MTNNMTLWERWQTHARNIPNREAIVYWSILSPPVRWSFADLILKAEKYCSLLTDFNIKPGQICALMLRHHPEFYPIYMGIVGLGAIPAVMSPPNERLHPDKFRQGIEGMSQRSGLDWILTERDFEEVLIPSINRNSSTIRGLLFPLEWDTLRMSSEKNRENILHLREAVKESDPALLQHSSGTTGLQKPVMLSHASVLRHTANYAHAIDLGSHDKIVSWLPLYHDMGLIAAFHLPLAFGISSVQLDPFEWLSVPALLLQVISKEKGTLSWLPNFSYSFMADKVHEDDLKDVRLESWRMAINCSEPIQHLSHEKFFNRFSPYGFKKSAFSSCYAMAETTFAVTQSGPNQEEKFISLDQESLSKNRVKINDDPLHARVCVSSGQLIPGCKIRLIGQNKEDLPEGSVGEIIVQSDSLFDGYRNYPEKTAEVLKNGWYDTGDYGFYHQGDYYILGRKKDVLIVAGNNIYPQDIEESVSQIMDMIPGRVMAFGEFDENLGTEQISIAAETNATDPATLKKLKWSIIKAAMDSGFTIRKVYLLEPYQLIKSSSGKLSRHVNKERILEGKIRPKA